MGLRKLDTTGRWKVNGDPIYVPDVDGSVLHSSIASESSGRTEDGVMHIEWLRTDIFKQGLKYALMTGEELEYMLSRMQGKVFRFTCPHGTGTKTIEAYVAETNATLYTEFQGVLIYKDVAINVIEM